MSVYPQPGVLGAQALAAAGHTVDTDWRWVRSLHVTHLAAGCPERPLDHRVEVLGDTPQLATRFVRAVQDGVVLATMTASFQRPFQERGPTHHPAVCDDWPDPYSLPATPAGPALDVRHLGRSPADPRAARRMWLRWTDEIPDRILLHAAALVEATGLLLVAQADQVLGFTIHFHRGFRADDWVRHEHETPVAAEHRALTTGRFFSSMGRLVASFTQEIALLPDPT